MNESASLLAPRSIAPRRSLHEPAWEAEAAPPPGWGEALAACGGGFFHAPPALQVALPAGVPVFARLRAGGETLAVALGVATRCRLARRPRHLRFAALPACTPGVERAAAAAALAARLAGDGAAEVVMDSFDSGDGDALPGGARPGRPRLEHVVSLDADEASLARRFARTHRHHVARGEREGWRVRALRGDQAARVLADAQATASLRASGRGGGFPVAPPPEAVGRGDDPAEPWGVCTFAALDGDAVLGAALVGWGGDRGYYLMGGSTEEGYRRDAAAWLHWRIMAVLRGAGRRAYNLGGVPAAAAEPGHPQYGLHRFKGAFGGKAVPCRGLAWEAAPRHLWLHRAASRLAAAVG